MILPTFEPLGEEGISMLASFLHSCAASHFSFGLACIVERSISLACFFTFSTAPVPFLRNGADVKKAA